MSSHEFPDFITPHDGTQAEISKKERGLVAQKFSSLVDDMLLNNAASVEHFENDIPQDKLFLKRPFNDNDYSSIEVNVHTGPDEDDEYFPASERLRKEIVLQDVVNEVGQDRLSYRLFADGVVRRYDDLINTDQLEREGLRPPNPGTTHDERVARVEHNWSELVTNVIPNRRLEQQVGMQLQPIGLDEVDRLTDFVTQPDTIPY